MHAHIHMHAHGQMYSFETKSVRHNKKGWSACVLLLDSSGSTVSVNTGTERRLASWCIVSSKFIVTDDYRGIISNFQWQVTAETISWLATTAVCSRWWMQGCYPPPHTHKHILPHNLCSSPPPPPPHTSLSLSLSLSLLYTLPSSFQPHPLPPPPPPPHPKLRSLGKKLSPEKASFARSSRGKIPTSTRIKDYTAKACVASYG